MGIAGGLSASAAAVAELAQLHVAWQGRELGYAFLLFVAAQFGPKIRGMSDRHERRPKRPDFPQVASSMRVCNVGEDRPREEHHPRPHPQLRGTRVGIATRLGSLKAPGALECQPERQF